MKAQRKRIARPGDAGFKKHVTVTVGPVVGEGKERYCRVEPSEVRVQWGGTVTFRCARGCGPLELFVPTPKRARDLFPRSGRLLGVPASSGRKTFGVAVARTKHPRVVEYPYAVYCRGCNCFGRGSTPRMITGPGSTTSS